MKRILLFFLTVLCSLQVTSQHCIVYTGDSVTDGKWGFECDGSRNTEDMNHIFGHGYMFLCASQYMADYPQSGNKFFNRGVSGNTITDLSARWSSDILILNPDVLSILIGINDVITGNNLKVDTVLFYKEYNNILSQSRKQNPELVIVLGEPFCEKGFRIDSAGTARRSCEALSRVVQRLAKEYNAVFIPYQSMFDELCKEGNTEYWIWDGVHPTPAGHYKMAQLWMKTVKLY